MCWLTLLRNEVAERNVSIEHLRLELEESRRQSASFEMMWIGSTRVASYTSST